MERGGSGWSRTQAEFDRSMDLASDKLGRAEKDIREIDEERVQLLRKVSRRRGDTEVT